MKLRSVIAGGAILLVSGCSWAGVQQSSSAPSGTPIEARASTVPSQSPEPSQSASQEVPVAERVAVVLPAPLNARLPGSLLGEVGEERGGRTRTWYAAVRVPEASLVDFFALAADTLRAQGYTAQQEPGSIVATHSTVRVEEEDEPEDGILNSSGTEGASALPDTWVYVTVLDSQYPESLAEGQRYVSVSVVERVQPSTGG